MPTEAPPAGRTLARQADWLLARAEYWLEQSEGHTLRAYAALTPGAVLVPAGGLALAYSCGPALACVYATLVSLAAAASARASRSRAHRDRRAALEAVGVLRELESVVADKAQLSALGRASLRVRLSRFDI